MDLFLQLSRQNPKLARAEALALLDGKELGHGPDHLIASTSKLSRLARLVMSPFVCRLIASCPLKGLPGLKLRLGPYESFAVRCTKLEKVAIPSSKIESIVGRLIRGKVDLKNPKTTIRAFVDKRNVFITKQLFEYDAKQLTKRQVKARPFIHPTSLQPKPARLMLNLSGVVRGKVLDPFAGAGGILIEASLMGLRATGIELDGDMYEGAKENLWFYRCDDVKLMHGDFLTTKLNKFDAIVTDLPYGISSSLFGKKTGELYESAFKKMRKLSKKLIVMGPKDLTRQLAKCGWKTEHRFKIYAHKSLTRQLHVCSSK